MRLRTRLPLLAYLLTEMVGNERKYMKVTPLTVHPLS